MLEKVKKMLREKKDLFMGELYRESIEKILESEVEEKAGKRYQGGKEYSRWGRNPGSITANGEKIKIAVP
ncbi:MAG: hypothetical protein GX452_09940 [Ignavibacteriales bacterium]|jgi:hypothetical protein|nr:hypothetical protein [Ignavibacteriaceae bacterium]NLH61711.1 hypothetical protein [Ignavibacteriales bacterium]